MNKIPLTNYGFGWRMDKNSMEKTVEEALPNFAKVCQRESPKNIIMSQEAFAGGIDYLLLGMAIKYAGLHKKTLTIVSEEIK